MNNKIFNHILINSAVSTVATFFIWFALTFFVFLETKSVLATSLIAGVFAVSNALSAIFFGAIVDHNKKKQVMIMASAASLFTFVGAWLIFVLNPETAFQNHASPVLWILIIVSIIGSVIGNLRNIALSTTVTMLFEENDRGRANGLIGSTNGFGFAITSVISGLVIGFWGMSAAYLLAIGVLALVLIHLFFITLPEKDIEPHPENTSKMDVKGTIAQITLIPGLFALIFFTMFNNFLGGVFMSLMDAYGLSLVSVKVWGFILGASSFAFIASGVVMSKVGLGKNPLRTLILLNMVTWTTCIFFTIQSSVILLVIGMVIWMFMMPIIEASEHTIVQNVVPFERQGRVFGFALSLESAASPITAFLIGPIAYFYAIPFMTTGRGPEIIGEWFGNTPERGIALVFIVAGFIGLFVTILARNSRVYKSLSEHYLKVTNNGEKVVMEEQVV